MDMRPGHEDLPLRQGGRASLPISLSINKLALLVEVVVDAGRDRDELLYCLRSPEAVLRRARHQALANRQYVK